MTPDLRAKMNAEALNKLFGRRASKYKAFEMGFEFALSRKPEPTTVHCIENQCDGCGLTTMLSLDCDRVEPEPGSKEVDERDAKEYTKSKLINWKSDAQEQLFQSVYLDGRKSCACRRK